MKRLFLCLAASLALAAGIVHAQSGDVVKTQDDAIKIARQACAGFWPAESNDGWEATQSKEGIWRVFFDGALYKPKTPLVLGAAVRASDGLTMGPKGFSKPSRDNCTAGVE